MGVADVVDIVTVKVEESAAVAILDPNAFAPPDGRKAWRGNRLAEERAGVALDKLATVLSEAGFGPLGSRGDVFTSPSPAAGRTVAFWGMAGIHRDKQS